jgi:two-component system chemotaxis sensor kinase CheA
MTVKGPEAFRALFAEEAEMRLTRLGQLVLELEDAAAGTPVELAVIGEIFREVHTIKGAAAVVGFEDVGAYAHIVEEHLDDLRSARTPSTPRIIDALLAAVDGLRILTWQAVDGEGAATTVADHPNLRQLAVAFSAGPAAEMTPAPAEAALPATALVAPAADVASAPVASTTPAAPGGAAGRGPAPATATMSTLMPVPTAPTAAEPVPAPTAEPVPMPVATPTPPAAEPVPVPVPAAGEPGAGAVRRAAPSAIMVPLARLDEIVRLVGEAGAAHLRIGRVLSERLSLEPSEVAEFTELSTVLNQLQDLAMRSRMVPVSSITDQLHRALRDAARSLGKDVAWEVRGETTELDRSVLQQLSDALLHLVRNAVDHGIDTAPERAAAGKPARATVRLHAMQLGSEVVIVVTDDGRGIDLDRVRQKARGLAIDTDTMSDEDVLQLIFESGLSTARFVSDISGRGVGLDAVRASVHAARGRVEVRSEPGVGCEFRVMVPVTLAVLRCLLIEVDRQRFALPIYQVVLARAANAGGEVRAEGRPYLMLGGQSVTVSDLATVLDLPVGAGPGVIVVLNGTTGRHAFRVDRLIGERDVAVKRLSPLLPRLTVVAAGSVEPDGSVLFMLDPEGLIERARHLQPEVGPGAAASATHSGRVLVVDDALTVRELQRGILERAGFEVVVAGDGLEALSRLAEQVPDLVLTDVEMPRMDGFALTEQIRARPALANVAVLILTSLAKDTDRQRGLDAGADGYIVKTAFNEKALLSAVDRVLGRRP